MKPNQHDMLYFCKFALLNFIIFVVLYGTANQLTSGKDLHPLYFKWEQNIPFYDWMIIPYMSLNLILFLHMFMLNKQQTTCLGLAFFLCTFTSFLCFMLYPCELGFSRTIPEGMFGETYALLFALDKPYNLFPSLHVTYATLYLLSIYKQLTNIKRYAFLCWMLTVMASAILTHQHHLGDLVGGILLAIAAYSTAYKLTKCSSRVEVLPQN